MDSTGWALFVKAPRTRVASPYTRGVTGSGGCGATTSPRSQCTRRPFCWRSKAKWTRWSTCARH
eukprot:12577298-Alexandrium_andersonii.AAC.1